MIARPLRASGSHTLFILILLFASPAGNSRGALPEAPHPQTREELQTLVAAEPDLDGVRIDHFSLDDDLLRVDGILASESQTHRLKHLLDKVTDRMGATYDFSAFEDPKRRKIVPITAFKDVVQEKFASDPILRGARIDRVYFSSDGSISFTGVVWLPEHLSRPTNPALRDRMEIAIMRLIANDERWDAYQDGGRIVLDAMTGLDDEVPLASPLEEIRIAVEEAAILDGVRIDTAYYDAHGVLVIEAIHATKGQEAECASLLRKVSDASPSLHLLAGSHESPILKWTGTLDLKQLIRAIEEAIRRAQLSSQPASNDQGTRVVDKVRIDRLFYNRRNQLSLQGLRWNEFPMPDRGVLDAVLRSLIHEVVNDRFPDALFSVDKRLDQFVNIDRLPLFDHSDPEQKSALFFLRQRIPKHPELDGVRIDHAYYEDRVLHFTGLHATPKQDELLQNLVDLREPLWRELAPAGIAFDALKTVRLDVLLQRLRARIAKNSALSGTLVWRAYYNSELALAIEVRRWKTVSQEEIDNAIHPEFTASDRWRQALSVVEKPLINYVAIQDNLLHFLRQQVSSRRDLDGVRLDSASYDTQGTLGFTGLIGRKDQLDLLREATEDASKRNPDFQDCTAGGYQFSPSAFRLLPIDPFLACVKNLLPAYKELDGVAVTRLYHLPTNELAVDGRAADIEQVRNLSKILGRELDRIFYGKHRLRYNSTDPKLVRPGRFERFVVERDSNRAKELLNDACKLYWNGCLADTIDVVGMAIAYDPQLTAAWYLRALCYIDRDQVPLARRDMRRAIMINKNVANAQESRPLFFQRVQGYKRLCFENIFNEVFLTRENGSLITDLCGDYDCIGAQSRTCQRCRSERIPVVTACPHGRDAVRIEPGGHCPRCGEIHSQR